MRYILKFDEVFLELFSYVLIDYNIPSTARKLFKAVTGV